MLIQRAGSGTLLPPGFAAPPWVDLAAQWSSIPSPDSPMVLVGPASLTMGHDDSEGDDKLPHLEADVKGRTFGWDNESPCRVVHVGAFRAEWRPVTNGEFETFWREARKDQVQLPKSWVMNEEDGSVKVFTSLSLSLLLLAYTLSFAVVGSNDVWPRPNEHRWALAGPYIL